jgi:SulP family sulfate permease
MKNERLNADRELIAQGIGNVLIPFFGGVPATAAIARTSVAIKSGGQTRLVSIVHALGLLLSMFLLGSVMSKIPLSALAGVLMVTAWRMNEWHEIKYIFDKRFMLSIAEFSITMAATVLFDLTIAILLGVTSAILLFVLKNNDLNIEVSYVDMKRVKGKELSADHTYTKIVYMTGPLYFITKDKLNIVIEETKDAKTVIFSMRAVTAIDSNGLSSLKEMMECYIKRDVKVLFCGVQKNVKSLFDRSGLTDKIGNENFYWDAIEAMESLEEKTKALS